MELVLSTIHAVDPQRLVVPGGVDDAVFQVHVWVNGSQALRPPRILD